MPNLASVTIEGFRRPFAQSHLAYPPHNPAPEKSGRQQVTIAISADFQFAVANSADSSREVVLEGLVVPVLSTTASRQAVMDAIPTSLKHAIAAGIGFFLTFLGLQDGTFLSSSPATLVTFGDFIHPVAALSILGLMITGWLLARRTRGAILIAIVALLFLPVFAMPVIQHGIAGK